MMKDHEEFRKSWERSRVFTDDPVKLLIFKNFIIIKHIFTY